MALGAIKDIGQSSSDQVIAAAKSRDSKKLAAAIKDQGKVVADAVAGSFTQSASVTALTNKLSAATQAAATAASQNGTTSSAAHPTGASQALQAYATAQTRAKTFFSTNRLA